MHRRPLMPAALVVLVGLSIGLIGLPASAASESLFGSTVPTVKSADDPNSVTVGTTVTTRTTGAVTGLRFYKGAGNAGTHVGTVFSANGSVTAQATFTNESSTGWQTVTLSNPVRVTSGTTLVAAVTMPRGHYAAANDYAWPRSSSSLTGKAGVYKYGSGTRFPTDQYRSSNYFIDVQFSPANVVTPTPTPSAPVPSATPTTSAPPTTSPSPTSPPTSSPTPQSPLLGWQLTKENVGLAPFGLSCSTLPAYTGSLKPAKGARISGVRIAGNMDLANGDIVIEKSCLQPPTGNRRALVSNDVCGNECEVTSADTVTIRDSEFDGDAAPIASIASACAFRGIGTLQRNYVHGMDSGICFFGTGYTLDGLAENNYVTGLRFNEGAHREAVTIRDLRTDSRRPQRTAKFLNNRLDTQGPGVTGSVFIQPTWVDIVNVEVTGNYLEGEGYNLYLEDKGGRVTNARATNNRFRSTGWGPSITTSAAGWSTWTDNYRYDASKPDARGAVVTR